MDRKLKSIAFSFKARDIELFTDFEQPNCFLINRLVCTDCDAYFHTSLLECFFCGEINYYLYTCDRCDDLSSITGNRRRNCNACHAPGGPKQYKCKNPDCFSNGNFSNTLNQISEFKGVFERNSQWNLSCVHCVRCGSPKHEYKCYRLFLYDKSSEKNDYNDFKNSHGVEEQDLIILREEFGEGPKGYTLYDYEIIGGDHIPGTYDKTLDAILDEILA